MCLAGTLAIHPPTLLHQPVTKFTAFQKPQQRPSHPRCLASPAYKQPVYPLQHPFASFAKHFVPFAVKKQPQLQSSSTPPPVQQTAPHKTLFKKTQPNSIIRSHFPSYLYTTEQWQQTQRRCSGQNEPLPPLRLSSYSRWPLLHQLWQTCPQHKG